MGNTEKARAAMEALKETDPDKYRELKAKAGRASMEKRLAKSTPKQRSDLARKAVSVRWLNWRKLQDSKTSDFKKSIRGGK